MDLVQQIASLSPARRRRLVKNLLAAGLISLSDGKGSDRDRLAVAPALSRRRSAPPDPLPPSPAPAGSPPARPTAPTDPPADYRSAVRGKTVVTPSTPAAEAPPSEMRPLPGQAPERPIQIIFDGGSRGNPGVGYGSYAVRWPGEPDQVVRLQFGDQVTNNEAEYDTLIAGVTAILERLRKAGADPKTGRLEIRGDSLLVINQVLGKWQCKEDRLRARRDRARRLLDQFGRWQMLHHDREENVRILGH